MTSDEFLFIHATYKSSTDTRAYGTSEIRRQSLPGIRRYEVLLLHLPQPPQWIRERARQTAAVQITDDLLLRID